MNAADTTISGASRLENTCSYITAPIVSDSGVARLITDISAANVNPSARGGHTAAARLSVATFATIAAMPPKK